MEMGYRRADSWSGSQLTGTDEFAMDAINCDSATDWSQCTFSTTEDCSNMEGVQLVCTNEDRNSVCFMFKLCMTCVLYFMARSNLASNRYCRTGTFLYP